MQKRFSLVIDMPEEIEAEGFIQSALRRPGVKVLELKEEITSQTPSDIQVLVTLQASLDEPHAQAAVAKAAAQAIENAVRLVEANGFSHDLAETGVLRSRRRVGAGCDEMRFGGLSPSTPRPSVLFIEEDHDHEEVRFGPNRGNARRLGSDSRQRPDPRLLS